MMKKFKTDKIKNSSLKISTEGVLSLYKDNSSTPIIEHRWSKSFTLKLLCFLVFICAIAAIICIKCSKKCACASKKEELPR